MVTQIGLHPTEPVAQKVAASPIDMILGSLILIIIIGVVIAIVYFIINWLFNKKDKGKDLYKTELRRNIAMCKVNKVPKYIKGMYGMPKFLLSKGVPIIVNYPSLRYDTKIIHSTDAKGKSEEKAVRTLSLHPGQSYKLGNYAGSCYMEDGTWTLLIKSSKLKVMGLFPTLLVLKLRMSNYNQTIIDPEDRTKVKIVPVPGDFYNESEERIMLFNLGIEKIGEFYYCVNVTADGGIVDARPFAHTDMLNTSFQKQLQDIGRNMVVMAEDWVKSSPIVQMIKRTGGGLAQD